MFKWLFKLLKKKPVVSSSPPVPTLKNTEVLGYVKAILGANRILFKDAIGVAKNKAEMLKEEASKSLLKYDADSKEIAKRYSDDMAQVQEKYKKDMAQVQEREQAARDKETESSQIYDAINFFNTIE